MNIYFILFLRIIHIVAGVLWVGSAILYLFFVEPTVKSIGVAGPQFVQHFVTKQRYPLYMNTISLLTILAGALLFWNTSGGLQTAWLKTGPGWGFTIGSAVGIAVYFLGFFMLKPRGERLGALGKEIGMSGGAPNSAQAAELNKLGQEISKIERLDFIMLAVALLIMATARYWSF